MEKVQKDALFIIDASSVLYRSYYGIKPLHTISGQATQAIYGFCRTLKKLADDYDPRYVVVVWDAKGKTFRSDVYPEYKATRQAAPSDLFSQKDLIITIVESMGVRQLSQPGYEADDIIAALVHHFPDHKKVIVGPDKDLFQLLDDHLVILDPLKKEITDRDDFIKKNGFEPTKLPFFHALVGDSSDNIPGVTGIGKKGATDLVQQFASLDDLYERLDEITKPRLKELLVAGKDDAFLSLKLFTLHLAPVSVTLKDLEYDKSKWGNANALFKELEFDSFVKHTKAIVKPAVPQQQSLFDFSGEAESDVGVQAVQQNWTCHLVRTVGELEQLTTKLKQYDLAAFDTETMGLDPHRDDIVGISCAVTVDEAYYIPIAHVLDDGEVQLTKAEVVSILGPYLADASKGKTFHNAKFDQLVLNRAGLSVEGIVFDSLLAANLLRQDWQKIGLKKLSLSLLGEPMETFGDLFSQYKNFSLVPLNIAANYGAHDSLQTLKLTRFLQKELVKEEKLKWVFDHIELPLSTVLYEMEKKGILLDPATLKVILHEAEAELATIETKIKSFAEHHYPAEELETINLNSPRQVERLLFDVIQLPYPGKAPKEGSRSTAYDILVELQKIHPVPGLLLRYRELAKLKSTYLEPLPQCINPETGRIHTSYSQTTVVTGRLASVNPNLQNIPASTGIGIRVRAAFVAAPGKRFLSADYSQIELRILAHFSQDHNLLDAFLHGKDIHNLTASQVFNVPLEEVTHDQRQVGKRLNFSIMYGMTAYGLSRELDVAPSEAKKYLDTYFEQYPAVHQWMNTIVEEAQQRGYVETFWGRRRYLPDLQERNKTLFEAARRAAINTPVQGTQAEVLKLAMIKLNRLFKEHNLDAAMLLQLHDELLIEYAEKDEEAVIALTSSTMENIVHWSVPLKVSVRTGLNWEEVTK